MTGTSVSLFEVIRIKMARESDTGDRINSRLYIFDIYPIDTPVIARQNDTVQTDTVGVAA